MTTKSTMLNLVIVLFGLLFTGFVNRAAEAFPLPGGQSAQQSHVRCRMIVDRKEIQPGRRFRVAVELTMLDGWHTYYKESGDAGMPTRITWKLPPGFVAGALEWQKPKRFDDAGLVTWGFDDHTVIAAMITPSERVKPGSKVELGAQVNWLECKNLCVPGSADLTVRLSVVAKEHRMVSIDSGSANGAAPVKNANSKSSVLGRRFQIRDGIERPSNLAGYLLLAFVGGLILNVMPCVLPVISIKVLGFVGEAADDPRRVFALGAAFASGIVVSFVALAALVCGLQSAGRSVGWGFQFQHPAFLIAMSGVVVLLALSLLGLLEINVSHGSGRLDSLAHREGVSGSFFKGILATVLATPCTAPFLGTALGFAFSQPWWVIVSVFFVAGLGMASPYLVLTARPGWMRYLPKPGIWMVTFRQCMGFVLLATAVWLLEILGKQVGVDGVLGTLCFLLVVSFSAWLVGSMTDLTSSNMRRWMVRSAALAISLTGYLFFVTPVNKGPKPVGEANSTGAIAGSIDSIAWQPFNTELLDRYLSQGKTVLVDFTADWCLTCKVNESIVLNSRAVIDEVKKLRVVALRADWTRQDPAIGSLLRRFGRSGVPLYVIFPATRPLEPIVLPEIITQQMMLEKLKEAGASRTSG